MNAMVEVVIDSVRVSLMSPQRIVILREKDAERYLPIWVGPYEAEAITVALQEVEMMRPLTHDLLKNAFTIFNALLLRVEIVSLRDDIFYGNIVAEVDGKVVNLDSRPSDAIALAVRTHVPILVGSAVMEVAGILPERDMQEELPSALTPASEGKSVGVDAERLSVFEDFLSQLSDNEDEDDQSDADKPKPKPKTKN
ncbi:MAG: bifunctional nuclease family protein [Chloroflexota bacterium]